jgi:hypothetical protein
MRCFLISSAIIVASLASKAAESATTTTYNMKWLHKGLQLETSMYQGTFALTSRMAEVGEFKNRSQLPILNDLPQEQIKIPPGESRMVILVIKNNSEKPLKFAVAPHSVAPIEASLGIKFNCLCNGHTYTVAPKTSWYRIMQLKTLKAVGASPTEVTLEHQIFAVK